MGVALVSLDVSGSGTYVSLTPFHIGEAGSDGGQANNNNSNNNNTVLMPSPGLAVNRLFQKGADSGLNPGERELCFCTLVRTSVCY